MDLAQTDRVRKHPDFDYWFNPYSKRWRLQVAATGGTSVYDCYELEPKYFEQLISTIEKCPQNSGSIGPSTAAVIRRLSRIAQNQRK